MRRGLFLRAAALLLASPALSAGAWAQEATFDPAVIRGDLDAIWEALLDVGAQPFRTSDRAAVEGLYRRARAGIAAPMTMREAWLAISPVLGALNDGHVGLIFGDLLNAAVYRFPLHLAIDDAGYLIVYSDRTKTLVPGSRVLSVEGVPAQRFVDATLQAYGGQTKALQYSRVIGAGAWTAIALFGDRSAYHVHWMDASDSAHDTILAATAAATTSFTHRAPYTFSTLHDGRTGYIDYRACEDPERFASFLAATFATIKTFGIDALIIDVRQNGGGDSDLNDALWTYASDKPFKQFGGTIEKSCERIKREYGKEKYVAIYGEAAWNAPNGTMFYSNSDPNAGLVEPKPLATRFNGPVYLLISTQTFSAAMSCALAAKDYGLATIVGEETGEPVNTTGEVYTMKTPGLGLQAFLTTKVFLAPKPHPDRQGVIPDVAVTITPTDLAAGRDPILARALELVAQGRGS
jgi:Peptidase family S41